MEPQVKAMFFLVSHKQSDFCTLLGELPRLETSVTTLGHRAVCHIYPLESSWPPGRPPTHHWRAHWCTRTPKSPKSGPAPASRRPGFFGSFQDPVFLRFLVLFSTAEQWPEPEPRIDMSQTAMLPPRENKYHHVCSKRNYRALSTCVPSCLTALRTGTACSDMMQTWIPSPAWRNNLRRYSS